MTVGTEQEISGEGETVMKNRALVGNPVAVGIFEDKDAVFFGTLIILGSLVGVVLLHEDAAIRCDSDTDRSDDIRGVGEEGDRLNRCVVGLQLRRLTGKGRACSNDGKSKGRE